MMHSLSDDAWLDYMYALMLCHLEAERERKDHACPRAFRRATVPPRPAWWSARGDRELAAINGGHQ